MMKVVPQWIAKLGDTLKIEIYVTSNKNNLNGNWVSDSIKIKKGLDSITSALMMIEENAKPNIEEEK